METLGGGSAIVMWIVMFFVMFVIGYFITMTVLINSPHIYNNLNRFYMTMYMTAWMMVGMTGQMLIVMGYNPVKLGVFIVSLIFVGIFYYLTEKQVGINTKQFARAMTEHHSMAITMSQQLLKNYPDSPLSELAQNIIKNQDEEIEEMNTYI